MEFFRYFHYYLDHQIIPNPFRQLVVVVVASIALQLVMKLQQLCSAPNLQPVASSRGCENDNLFNLMIIAHTLPLTPVDAKARSLIMKPLV